MLQQTIVVLDLTDTVRARFALFSPVDPDLEFNDKVEIYVPIAVFDDLGEPKQITVTIQPGDGLNP